VGETGHTFFSFFFPGMYETAAAPTPAGGLVLQTCLHKLKASLRRRVGKSTGGSLGSGLRKTEFLASEKKNSSCS